MLRNFFYITLDWWQDSTNKLSSKFQMTVTTNVAGIFVLYDAIECIHRPIIKSLYLFTYVFVAVSFVLDMKNSIRNKSAYWNVSRIYLKFQLSKVYKSRVSKVYKRAYFNYRNKYVGCILEDSYILTHIHFGINTFFFLRILWVH